MYLYVFPKLFIVTTNKTEDASKQLLMTGHLYTSQSGFVNQTTLSDLLAVLIIVLLFFFSDLQPLELFKSNNVLSTFSVK